MGFQEFLDFHLFTLAETEFTVERVLLVIGILVAFRLLVWLVTSVFLKRYAKRRKLEEGRTAGIAQLLSYLLYLAGFLTAMQAGGIQLTVLLAAGAALLVGVGIGLQSTFNDIISGIILLLEGSIEKGDWLRIGDMEGTVERIGLRSSLIRTRRRIAVIVPNAKMTGDNVINYSHTREPIRYWVEVGVAYGSSVELVQKILLEAAQKNEHIPNKPDPFVRLARFADSSLDFELHFFTRNIREIEDVRSNLRVEIEKLLRANDVVIPFPQRTIHQAD
jgi:small-conductance mechanosensitive channel